MKSVRNKLLVFLSAAIMAFCGVLGVGIFTQNALAKAEAAPVDATLTIQSNNVSYGDSVYILYAVSHDGFDWTDYEVKMLFWTELQDDYVVGTQQFSSETNGVRTVKGLPCLIFYSEGLAAKEMTTDVYARAYVKIGNYEYYSDVVKFSVLEYVYTMRENGDLTDEKAKLFDKMLDYGGAAQENFKYETDRLANDTYYKIEVEDGKHDDGFSCGRYKPGDHCTIHPNDPPSGKHFSHWEDEHGNVVSPNPDFEFDVGNGNCVFKPIYRDDDDKGTSVTLEAEIDYDGTVDEIGLPEEVSFVYNKQTVTLGVTWNTDYFVEKKIGAQTLYATLNDLDAYKTYNIEPSGISANVTTLPYTLSQLTDGTYKIDGYFGEDESLTLPDTYKKITVSTVGAYAFDDKDTLKSVTLGNGYTTLSEGAFRNCDNLTDVTVGTGVSEIGTYAFHNCYGLTNFVLGSNVKTIGGSAFYNCYNLQSINLGNKLTRISDNAFYNCYTLDNVTLPDTLKSIGSLAFDGCSSLTSITIPDSVMSVGGGAFVGCTNLASVKLGKQLKRIESDTFSGCRSLTSVVISDGVTSIGWDVFSGCSSLTSIVIPDNTIEVGARVFTGCTKLASVTLSKNLKEIAHSTFYNCSSLTSIVIPDSVTSIYSSAFYGCSSLTSVKIGNGVTSIYSSAFYGCSSLASINIPDGVTSIGERAFLGCSSLASINIPDGVTSIGQLAFENCSSLTNIVIPDGVTSIGSYAFSGCSSLASINVPDSVTSIGSYTFQGCSGLTSVKIGNSVTSIGACAFSGCSSLTSIVIPDSVTSVYWSAFSGCTNLASVTLGNNLKEIQSSTFANCSGLTSITIPDSVTCIGNSAFSGCSGLTSIVIPDSVTSIGNSAFGDCNGLTSITIGDGVTSIDQWAFYGRMNWKTRVMTITIGSSLTSIGYEAFSEIVGTRDIYIKNIAAWCDISGLENLMGRYGNGNNLYLNNELITNLVLSDDVTSIGDYAFYDCSGLTSVVFGDDVTSIGDYAFSSCDRLTSVTIGKGVTSIGKYAFDNCDNLTSVYYKGAESDWKNISIGNYNSALINAIRYYLSDNSTIEPDDNSSPDVPDSSVLEEDSSLDDIPDSSVPEEDSSLDDVPDSSVPEEDSSLDDIPDSSVPEEDSSLDDVPDSSVPEEDSSLDDVPVGSGSEEDSSLDDVPDSFVPEEDSSLDDVPDSSVPEEDSSSSETMFPQAITEKPTEDTAYKLYVYQTTKAIDCYFNGSMSGFYFATVENYDGAVDLYVEYKANSDEFDIYFTKDGTKTYIGVEESWNSKIERWRYDVVMGETAPSSFVWNDELNTIVTTISCRSDVDSTNQDAEQTATKTLFFGNYNTYMTFSACDINYASTSNVGGLVIMADKNNVTSEQKVAAEKETLTVASEIVGSQTIELPSTGSRYSDVTIAWSVSGDNATLEGNALTITAPTANTTITLTATITCGEATEAKEFSVVLSSYELPAADSVISIEKALEIGETLKKDTANKYYVIGKVVSIANTTYGNLTIEDENGKSIYVYGTYDATGVNRYNAMENQPQVGDTVKLYSIVSYYNNAQLKNAWVVELTAAETPDTGDSSNSSVDTPDSSNTESSESNTSSPVGGDETPDTNESVSVDMMGTTNLQSRTDDKTIYSANGITYVNDKASSTATSYNPTKDTCTARAYQGSTITVSYTTAFTKVVFTLDDYSSGKYLTGFDGMEIAGATIARDNDVVTITFSTAVTSFTTAELLAQVRIEKIEVFSNGTSTDSSEDNSLSEAPDTPDDSSSSEDSSSGDDSSAADDMGAIVDEAYQLDEGSSMSEAKTLTGVVTKIDTAYSSVYTNVTVTIVVAGKEDNPIQCYRMRGDEAASVKIGDTITVTGTLKNYSGKIRFDSGCTLDKLVTSDDSSNSSSDEWIKDY